MAERKVTPRDCSLLVGIPTSDGRFYERLHQPSGYVAGLSAAAGWMHSGDRAAWRIYERQVLTPVFRAIERVQRSGVDVAMEATCETLVEHTRRRHVVTLMAHCGFEPDGYGAVEFIDGSTPLRAVARALPPGFERVLDLALCGSSQLGEIVKQERPECLVITHVEEIQPVFRALFYAGVIALLAHRPQRFTDAAADLAKKMSEQ